MVERSVKAIILSGGGRLFAPIVSVIVAFIVSGILILAVGRNPLIAYAVIIQGSIGSIYALSVTCVRMTPLLLAGLGVTIGFRAGAFNIGGEGQIYAGAIGATLVGILPVSMPAWIHLPFAVTVAFLFGVLWVSVPAYLRAYHNVNEIVTTLMFNYLGYMVASYLINSRNGPLFEPGASFNQSLPIAKTSELPILIKGSDLHVGFIFALLVAVAVFVLINYTRWGFQLRMVGANPTGARYAGVNVPRQILWTMLLGGGLAGLAGGFEVLGLRHRLFEALSPGYGYDAIAVTLLAKANPLATIITAGFFGGLRAGSNLMQQTIAIDVAMVSIIQAMTVFCVIGGAGLQLRHFSFSRGKVASKVSEVPPHEH